MALDEGAEGALRRVRLALDAAGVPYMLTGSFASAFHGTPRTTQDVDVVIAPTLGSLNKLLSQFPEEQYYVSREAALQAYGSESLFNVIDLTSGWTCWARPSTLRQPRTSCCPSLNRQRLQSRSDSSMMLPEFSEPRVTTSTMST